MYIVYLHGFSSAAASYKANRLKQALAPTPFLILDYPSHQPVTAIASIEQAIESLYKSTPAARIVLMGSSLGGYYAQYLAANRNDIDSVVLINPALDPQPPLKPWIGRNSNMVSGEVFDFSSEDWAQLAQYDVPAESITTRTLLLIDGGDEVISPEYAIQKYHSIPGKTIVYPNGSHAFDHIPEALPEIADFLAK